MRRQRVAVFDTTDSRHPDTTLRRVHRGTGVSSRFFPWQMGSLSHVRLAVPIHRLRLEVARYEELNDLRHKSPRLYEPARNEKVSILTNLYTGLRGIAPYRRSIPSSKNAVQTTTNQIENMAGLVDFVHREMTDAIPAANNEPATAYRTNL
jgi:hypothetical protein